jgi:DNA-binding MarR family transcriptional regulator
LNSKKYQKNALPKIYRKKRCSHSSDRQKQNLKLTDKGVSLLENLLPDYWSRIYNLMKGLTEKEERQLVQLLRKISDKISELTKD